MVNMKRSLIRSLMLIACFGVPLMTSYGQKLQGSGTLNSNEQRQAGATESMFNLTQIHSIYLTLTVENWEKMQPPQMGGAGGGFGLPAGMRPIPGGTPPGGDVLIGPQGGLPPQGASAGGPPGRFGLEFDYVHGGVEVDGTAFKDAGIRFKGNASYMSSQRGLKRPFRIALNKYEKNAHFNGVTTLILNNNIMDPAMMRETIAYPLFRSAGLPASRTGYAKVFLTVAGKYEREYLGLYTLVEFVDEAFLHQHFGNSEGLLLKPEGMQGGVQYLGENWDRYKERYDAKTGDKGEQGRKGRQHLIQFANLVNNGTDEEFRQKINEYLDVDAFLRFLAVNVLTSNLDSILAMGHNYYIYLNPNTNKFVFFSWDLDLSFAGFPMGGSSEQQIDLSIDHPYTGTNKLIERLLAMESVKKTYYNHLETMLKDTFNLSKLEAQIAVAEQLIRETMKAEPAQPSGPMGRPGGGRFGGGISIREFISRRGESIRAQLSGKSKGFVPLNRMRMGGGPGGFGPPGTVIVRPGMMEAPMLLKALDTDQSKAVSNKEFTVGAQQFFTAADTDKNERLNNDEINSEFERLFSAHGVIAPSFVVARSVLRLADTNRDGQVTAREWNTIVGQYFIDLDTNKNQGLEEAELVEAINRLLTQSIPRFETVTPSPGADKPPRQN